MWERFFNLVNKILVNELATFSNEHDKFISKEITVRRNLRNGASLVDHANNDTL